MATTFNANHCYNHYYKICIAQIVVKDVQPYCGHISDWHVFINFSKSLGIKLVTIQTVWLEIGTVLIKLF